jgi:hypothetical protein
MNLHVFSSQKNECTCIPKAESVKYTKKKPRTTKPLETITVLRGFTLLIDIFVGFGCMSLKAFLKIIAGSGIGGCFIRIVCTTVDIPTISIMI